MLITLLRISIITIQLTFAQLNVKELAILYDSNSILKTHTIMLDMLKDTSVNSFEIGKLTNSSFSLTQFNKLKFKNLFLISSQSTKWGISASKILEFADLGGNVFMVGGLNSGRTFAFLVGEFGFKTRNDTTLNDHANTVELDYNLDDQGVFIKVDSKYASDSKALFPDRPDHILYNGQGFGIDKTNPMTFPILTASATAYLSDPSSSISKFPLSIGEDIILVGGVEMRNKARAVIMGSVSALNDKMLLPLTEYVDNVDDSPSNGNMRMFNHLCNWLFQHSGIIRIVNPSHILVSSGKTQDEYIVDTLLEYSITIEELNKNGEWIPYIMDDIQLELIRLTTFSRLNYNHTQDGRYTARFYSPDFIGTYGLHTRYRRLGYTSLDHQVKIIIRPRGHNDYTRYLKGAWPYYLTAFLTMSMTYLLVVGILNQASSKQKSD